MLALVTIVNSGSSTAYLRSCNGLPFLLEEEFVGGNWESIPPLGLCVPELQSVALAAGDSLQRNWFFGFPTKSRLVLDVGTVPDLADAQTAASAAVVLQNVDTP